MERVAPIAILLIATAGWSQDTASIRGRVISAGGQPVAYAEVRAATAARSVLADSAGRFVLGGLASGSQRVRVEQIGYATLDTVLNTATSEIHVLVVQLRPIELPPVSAVAPARDCTVRGFHSQEGGPQVAAVMEEAARNANRYRLLLDTHDLVVRHRRTRQYLQPGGRLRAERTDTVTEASRNVRPRYEPGRVLIKRSDAEGGGHVLLMPSLYSIGQTQFHESHCFRFMGVDTIAESPVYRIDFVPVKTITGPDVAGALYLDRDTYVLRSARFSVIQLPRGLHFSDVTVDVQYREILPALVISESIQSYQRLKNVRLEGDRVDALLTLETLIQFEISERAAASQLRQESYEYN